MASAQAAAPPILVETPPLVGAGVGATPSPLPPNRFTLARLGIESRFAWSCITLGLLFVGKATQPFAMDIVHVTQAALVEDPRLGISATALGSLVAVQDFTSGASKLLVAVVLRDLGPPLAGERVRVELRERFGQRLPGMALRDARHTAQILDLAFPLASCYLVI